MRERRTVPAQLVVGAALIGVFVGVALVSLLWTPYDPAALNVTQRLAPPGTEGHILGTDKFGRDVVSQIMAGAQNSLFVAVVSTSVSVVPGVLLGLLAAASSRGLGDTISRAIDVVIALPGILIALVLATAMGPRNTTTIIAIAAALVPLTARLVIGPARQILARDFVAAAFAYGRSRWFVLVRHVLPNIAPVIIVSVALQFSIAILIEASLAYLGAGAQRPTTSWGLFFNESQTVVGAMPTLVLFPGIVMVLAILGFNLLGDGLRTLLDPRRAVRADVVRA